MKLLLLKPGGYAWDEEETLPGKHRISPGIPVALVKAIFYLIGQKILMDYGPIGLGWTKEPNLRMWPGPILLCS